MRTVSRLTCLVLVAVAAGMSCCNTPKTSVRDGHVTDPPLASPTVMKRCCDLAGRVARLPPLPNMGPPTESAANSAKELLALAKDIRGGSPTDPFVAGPFAPLVQFDPSELEARDGYRDFMTAGSTLSKRLECGAK